MTVTNGHAESHVTDVTLVLPCRDEAESIQACIAEARAAMAGSPLAFEVVVVDNGSTDGTGDLARMVGARVVDEAVPGYGSALLRGISEASGEVVVMADADLTYDLSRLPDLVGPVFAGTQDLVLGGRLESATNESMPFLHRYVGTPVLSMLVRRAAGRPIGVDDSQSGFRAFRRSDVLGLGLQGTGMEFASEMLIQAAQAGFRITEIPTDYRPRVGDSKLSTVSDGLRHLSQISLLAPSVVVKGPGAVLLTVGLLFNAMGLIDPGGVAIGSARWQPIFLATILSVLGTLAILAGWALERLSPVARSSRAIGSSVGDLRSARRLACGGCIVAVLGLVVDVALLLGATPDGGLESRRLAASSLATTLIIVGSVTALGGLLGRLLLAQWSYQERRTELAGETGLERQLGLTKAHIERMS